MIVSFTNEITYMLFHLPLMYVFKTLFYNIRGSYSDDLAPQFSVSQLGLHISRSISGRFFTKEWRVSGLWRQEDDHVVDVSGCVLTKPGSHRHSFFFSKWNDMILKVSIKVYLSILSMSNGTDLGHGTKKQGGFGFEKQAKIIEQTRKINIVLTLINSKNILYFTTMALENMVFLKMALPSDRANTKQNIIRILFFLGISLSLLFSQWHF